MKTIYDAAESGLGRRCAWLLLILLMLAAGLSAGCWNRRKQPPVILVIIDTLPAGHSSAYGYPRSTTPALDSLAADGIRFERAVTASPWTLPAIASLLTGDLPSRHLAGFHPDPWTQAEGRLAKMRTGLVTLANLFQTHGYLTVGFFNNPFVHPGYGLNQGFDTYDYVEGDNLRIRPAPEVVNSAVKWMQDHPKKPFFMVVHFFDPHLAYNPPITFAAPYIADYQGQLTTPFNPDLAAVRSGAVALTDADKKFIGGLFDGEVVATDSELGRFLAYLKRQGLYDSSLIIVTADHGEEFWEHGGFEHGHSLHREVLEVPLVMKYPNSEFAGKTVAEYVSLVDLFPTVAEFMKWPLTFPVDGVSLYPKAGQVGVMPHVIVAENLHYGPQQQAFYSENLKLIVNTETGKTVIYDLSKDPGETRDVFGEIKLPESIRNQVQKIAKDLEAQLKKATPAAANLDPETIQKLKSLGYISF